MPGCKFATSYDLILSQEILAVKAYIAPHGETVMRYTRVAERCSTNPSFLPTVKCKSVQDLFRIILEDFDIRDQEDTVLSGTEGKIGELGQLLGRCLSQRRTSFR